LHWGSKALRPIEAVARELGISSDTLIPYGKWKAKVSLPALEEKSPRKSRGKVILVTAMTPTPHGEGKTVTAIGLAMALHKLGRKSVVCLRQPSLGPVFGVKGGAAGRGKSTVEPMQEINMRFTGDIDAVGVAHNLLAAILDNHISHGNELAIDPRTIALKRVLDMNDRALRQIVVGLGGTKNGVPRETGFEITAASEVMAVLSLSKDYAELKKKLSMMILGYTREGKAVRAGDLNVVGAMAAVLRETMEPNLVQTSEGTPAFVHGGCFGNIAHGTTTNISILLGRKQADYCVVEAGFGSDLGAEKFVDIAARIGRFDVDAAVVVASIRAIKHHSRLDSEEPAQGRKEMSAGLENLSKHIENVRAFGLTPVVALNKFADDTPAEVEQVEDFCATLNVPFAVSTAFEEGGLGATALAERVLETSGKGEKAKPLYPLEWSVEEKLSLIVEKIYGGEDIDFSLDARRDLKHIAELNLVGEPVCVAKTHLSLSDDESKLGRPHGFSVSVRNLELAAGAGFNIAYMGDIVTMPGLPKRPAAEKIDLDNNGAITGLQ
jgi:formate--tetrahydrofolate ligase